VIEQARVDAGQPSSPSPAPSASSSTVSLTGGPPAPTSGLPHLQSSYNNSIQENNNISRTSGAYPNTNALPNLMGTNKNYSYVFWHIKMSYSDFGQLGTIHNLLELIFCSEL